MMFKLIVVRTDGITHESEFRGWFAETTAYNCFKSMRYDEKRTQSVFIYAGHKSPDSSDIVWTLRDTHHN